MQYRDVQGMPGYEVGVELGSLGSEEQHPVAVIRSSLQSQLVLKLNGVLLVIPDRHVQPLSTERQHLIFPMWEMEAESKLVQGVYEVLQRIFGLVLEWLYTTDANPHDVELVASLAVPLTYLVEGTYYVNLDWLQEYPAEQDTDDPQGGLNDEVSAIVAELKVQSERASA